MNVEIVGCRGEIHDKEEFIERIRQFGDENKAICQIMNADMVYGREHILSAVEHALRAFENGTNSCKTPDMEILLYASGKRQIKDAIEFMGIGKSGKFVFVYAGNGNPGIEEFLEELGLEVDSNVMDGDILTLDKFGIGDEEMKTVDKSMYGDLILEKVAMVDLIK
ncbi:MAG: hypothetical protein J7L93_01595 [Thermoplasmata archaeon]|nr:hypothetical protein [Thermoplasmata archaeon]